MRTRRAACVALVAIAACATSHRIVLDGGELRRSAPLLRAYGSAVVDADDERTMGEDDMPAHYRVRETLHTDQTVIVDGTPRAVRDLVALCDPTAGAPCPLDGLEGFPLTLRRYTTHSVGKAVGGIAIVGLLGATAVAAGCELGCRDGSTPKQVSEITLLAVGGAVAVLLGYIVVDCFILDGGCHD